MDDKQIEDQYQNLEIAHQLSMVQLELSLGEYNKALYHFKNIGRFKLSDCKSEIEEIFSHIKDKKLEQIDEMISNVIDKLHKIIFDFKCDKGWNSLFLTSDEKVRFCQGCRKNVYLIDNEQDLKKHLQANDCIYYSGIVDTPKSCQITQLDDPNAFKKMLKYFRTGPMGSVNL